MKEETKQELKKEGAKLAQKVVRESIETTFTVLDIVINDSENKIDDMLLPLIPTLKNLALKYADKINEPVSA